MSSGVQSGKLTLTQVASAKTAQIGMLNSSSITSARFTSRERSEEQIVQTSSLVLDSIIETLLSDFREKMLEAKDAAVEECGEEGEDSPAFREYYGWFSAYEHAEKNLKRTSRDALNRLTSQNIDYLEERQRDEQRRRRISPTPFGRFDIF